MLTLVLVEDNEILREELCAFLSRRGWQVHAADCGEQLNELLHEIMPDIIVLDVNLPYEDGYSIASRLRQSHPYIGLIMLTARTRPADRVQGYKTGADIYLTKPTHTEELEAAIGNLAQRLQSQASTQMTLDRRARRLIAVNGFSCSLTPMETTLLEIMAVQQNHEAGLEFLLEMLQVRTGEQVGRANLTVLISRLRSKVMSIDQQLNLICAIRKVGYRLQQPLVIL